VGGVLLAAFAGQRRRETLWEGDGARAGSDAAQALRLQLWVCHPSRCWKRTPQPVRELTRQRVAALDLRLTEQLQEGGDVNW
jgi:hypothetical protein